MPHYHDVVWLDHSEAHVMHISPDDVEKSIIHPSKPHQHLHSRRGTLGSGKAPPDKTFFPAVVDALEGAEEILVLGPAQAKLELIKHINQHIPDLSYKVVGVETVDHPSDGQIVAYARKYFVAKDRMLAGL